MAEPIKILLGSDSLGPKGRVKSKVLPEPYGPLGGADLRFIGPQPDTSLHCKDRGYRASASRGVSVYSRRLCRYQIILLGNRGTWV